MEEILHLVITSVVYPTINRLFYTPGGVALFPSTVSVLTRRSNMMDELNIL